MDAVSFETLSIDEAHDISQEKAGTWYGTRLIYRPLYSMVATYIIFFLLMKSFFGCLYETRTILAML